MKNKPKKWGIKLYALVGSSGLIYDFLMYQGSTTEYKSEYAAFGKSAGTVVQLADRIGSKNHRL